MKAWLFAVALLQSSVVLAQSAQSSWARTGVWDFMLHPQYMDSVSTEFQNGSRADVNEDYGFGFGMNYNQSQRLAFGFDFSWNEANYNGTRILDTTPQEEQKVGGVLQSSSITFNGDYYFTEGRIAPFVTGNLGWTFVDSNIPSGPPQGVCWWDPYWWTYVCGEYVPTRTYTEFGYGVGIGLRWDVTRGFFLRGSVNERWFDIDGAKDDINVSTVRVDIGFALR